MPVLVTNADEPPGLTIALAVAGLGGEVRAWCTGAGDVASLRAAGIYVSVGTPDDEGRLEAALAQVHTVIHLEDPTLASAADVWASRAGVVLRAATGAGVRRIIARSVPGAGTTDDELSVVTGAWEQALVDAPSTSLVVRTALVATEAMHDALATAIGLDLGDATIAPVPVDHLVDGVVTLDDARSSVAGGHAVFHLEGDTTTVADHLARVSPGGLVGRTWVPPTRVPLLPHAVRLPVGRDPDAADLRTFNG